MGRLFFCLFFCLSLVLFLLAVAFPARAEKRVALVIGNGAYVNAATLANPVNDAADVAQALRGIGFEVIEGRDLDKHGMEAKIQEFGARLDRAGLALFFYAGHGMQVNGQNYLVPTDAKLERAGNLRFETIDMGLVLAQMEAEKRVNLVFLDACRDNPLARTFSRSLGASRSASVGRGLASLQSAVGTMIAYATQPDNVALDGDERNSPFTAALLKHIATPGLEVRSLMTRVRADVLAATRERQLPWDHSSLLGEVVLVPQGGGSTVAKSAPLAAGSAPGADELAWNFVRDARDPDVLRRFIEQFPASGRRDEAVHLLRSLERFAARPYEAPAPAARPAAPEPAVRSPIVIQAHAESIQGVTFSPDGSRLASASFDRTVKVWNAATGELIRVLPHGSSDGHSPWEAAFSADGRRIVSVGGNAKIWDLDTGGLIRTTEKAPHMARSIQFAPDDRHFVTGSMDNKARLWDAETGKLVRSFDGHPRVGNFDATIIAARFSPDGRTVASLDQFATLKIWEAGTGRLIRTVEKVGFGGSDTFALSADGRWVASGLGLIDLASGQVARRFQRKSFGARAVALSRDGRRIALAGYEKIIEIFDTETGSAVTALTGHGDAILSIDFSPDGRWLASGGLDKTIRIWPLAADAAAQVAAVPQARPPAGVRASELEKNRQVEGWSKVVRSHFRTSGAEECRDACIDTRECRAWHYFWPNHRDNKSMCVLFDRGSPSGYAVPEMTAGFVYHSKPSASR